ncbi:MAG TPA: hypothetical protein VN778_03805, partial [Verrucomicrobiae bacterium]|nr:hypothetical protein [Verrucomicrobiae bacterium]
DEHEQIITHTRYSTEPGDSAVGAHPFECRTTGLKLALNGELRGQSLAILAKKNDLDPRNFGNKTELLTNIIGSTLARREEKKALTVEETGKTLRRLFAQLEGAFCLSIIFRDMSILVRDPWGRHPLSVGFLPDGKIVGASESMAFDDIGDQDDPHLPFLEVRDVEPGEIIIRTSDTIQSFNIPRKVDHKLCPYEVIYIADERSVVYGAPVWQARYNMGVELAKAEGAPPDVDIVVGVPNTGIASAQGYAEAHGKLFMPQAITKNPKYPKNMRTFISEGEAQQALLATKFIVDKSIVEGKKVASDDDSTIKGNVYRQTNGQLEEAGATEIHNRSSSPPYRSPCTYGMDTTDVSKLVARGERTEEEVAKDLGAKSMRYNTPEAVEKAIDDAKNDFEAHIGKRTPSLLGRFCWECVSPVQVSPVDSLTTTIYAADHETQQEQELAKVA